ncbi:N-acetylneuraminate synthase family protein [Candidatus Woesearchaeota archaeon]|nr:N-acetylneuraminate synthase family protein [Candidatus Woesearchaeota archaeon]
MIVLKRGQATKENIDRVVKEIEQAGLRSRIVRGELDAIVCVVGDESDKEGLFEVLSSYDFVERATPVQSDVGYKLIARENLDEYNGNLNTVKFRINGVEIGNGKPVIIAGPCAVHSKNQTLEIADAVKEAGADMLRGGAYKPRTSPYGFQGLREEGLKILAEARERTGLPVVTEVTDTRLVDVVGQHADMFQIGARNMQNYPLLTEVGKYAAKHDKGILMKTSHGMPTLKEVLCAAEYLAYAGARKIVLCERGMAAKTGNTRNTPNPIFLGELREHTYFPVIGDPSHSTGHIKFVIGASDSYLAAGANGLIIEVRRDDEKPRIDGIAVCDFAQSLPLSKFKDYMLSLKERKVR